MNKGSGHSYRPIYLILGLLVFAPMKVSGNPSDIFGHGSRAIALGGAFTALADDYSAVYYNPGGITQVRDATVSFAPIYVYPHLWIDDPGQGKAKQSIPQVGGFFFGVVGPMGKLFGLPNLSIGFSLFMPFDKVINAFVAPRNNTRFFPMYQDHTQRMSFTLVMAYRFHQTISIGLGVDFSMALSGFTTVDYNPDPQWQSDKEIDITVLRDLTVKPALYAGLLFTPHEAIRIGLSYRGEVGVPTNLGNRINLSPIFMNAPIHYLNYYTPTQITLGFASRPLPFLTVSCDLNWIQWSSFRGTHQEKPDPPFRDVIIPGWVWK